MVFSQADIAEIRKRLEVLKNNVKMLLFVDDNCESCKHAEAMLQELAKINPLISFEKHDLNSKLAKVLGIERAPTITFEAKPNVRFVGLPLGYEFAVFLEDIIAIGNGSAGLELSLAKEIAKIKEPTKVMVFTTPTCPYCPMVVKTFHDFAMFNDKIVASMIDASEHADLAAKWNVYAVPKVIINGKIEVEGMQPPQNLAKLLTQSI